MTMLWHDDSMGSALKTIWKRFFHLVPSPKPCVAARETPFWRLVFVGICIQGRTSGGTYSYGSTVVFWDVVQE